MERPINFGKKTRTKIVLSEFLIRLLELLFVIVMLIFQLLFMPFMIFSQKKFDGVIDIIRKHINDDFKK